MVHTASIVAALLVVVGTADGACPNSCSGHGTCGKDDVCSCFANWQNGEEQGGDCSDRTCPFDFAFADTPTGTNSAHWYAECSGKGICDRKSGECDCFDGYTGKACARTTCPNDCSEHGTCEYIGDVPLKQNMKAFDEAFTHSSLWDANKSRMCVCDAGYTGIDCSTKICPFGNDPLNRLNEANTATDNQKQDICFLSPNPAEYVGEVTIEIDYSAQSEYMGHTDTETMTSVNAWASNNVHMLKITIYDDNTITGNSIAHNDNHDLDAWMDFNGKSFEIGYEETGEYCQFDWATPDNEHTTAKAFERDQAYPAFIPSDCSFIGGSRAGDTDKTIQVNGLSLRPTSGYHSSFLFGRVRGLDFPSSTTAAVKNLNDDDENIIVALQGEVNFDIANLRKGSVDGTHYTFNIGNDSVGHCLVKNVELHASGLCDTSWGGSSTDFCLEFSFLDSGSSVSCGTTVLDNFGNNFDYSFLPGRIYMPTVDDADLSSGSYFVGNDRNGYCLLSLSGIAAATDGSYADIAGLALAGCYLENQDEVYNEVSYWLKPYGALGGVSGEVSIDFRPTSGGIYTTNKIDMTSSSAASSIAEALNSLPNNVIDSVSVASSTSACSVETGIKNTKNNLVNIDLLAGYTVSFDAYTNAGDQNLLSVSTVPCGNGCQPKISGLETASNEAILSAKVVVSQQAESNSYECGARGKCDGSSGICECFSGFTGESCSTVSTLV